MAIEFKFPDVGEGIAEGEVKKWHVQEGQTVEEHKTLVEVETDKAVVAIPSPKTGVLLKIHVPEGKVIHVGEVLATIGEAGETAQAPPAPTPPAAAATPGPSDSQPPMAPHVAGQKGVSVVGELEEAPPEQTPGPAPAEVIATPAVRRLARELGVDLAKITGTGPNGRITEQDVRGASVPTQPTPVPTPVSVKVPAPMEATIAPPSSAPAESEAPKVVRKYDMWGYVERVPFKGIRKVIADHMVRSAFTAPHVTHMDEADVTHLWEVREREAKVAAEQGVKLTFLPFVMKAVVAALKAHPSLNATLDEKNQEVIIKKYYNFGIAVDAGEGLVVPVVKGVDQKNMLDIAREIVVLAERTRQRKLDLQDLQGGTFSVTNVGSIGGLHATPIINYPEVAILAMGRIGDQARVVNGQIVARKVLPLSVAFDHRVLDGAEVARFTTELKKYLEDPDALMMV